MSLDIRRLSGEAIAVHRQALGELRIQVFREFPYLYDGTLEYEFEYLQRYFQNPESLAVLVFDEEQLVGASTAIPLLHEQAAFQKPFLEQGMAIDRVLYFGESILLAPYRGRGLGHVFFDEREAHARRLSLPVTSFCAVERAVDHPQRPSNYTPLDGLWNKRGYQRRPDLQTTYSWPDYSPTSTQPTSDTPKVMTFWVKENS